MELIISFLIAFVSAHSWVECTDYRGSTDVYEATKCHGLPRPLSDGRNVGALFGGDIGMDHRPGSSNNQCQGSISRGLQANYPTMTTYQVGQTYTLAWPPKNHVAAECTNQHIPSTSLTLRVHSYDGVSDPATFTQQVPASFSEFPHEEQKMDFKGFQNCPKFCENTDKSLCTGSFQMPELAPGIYTFQWNWAFNSATDIYTTCWEAQVLGGSATPAPTAVSNVPTTSLPTFALGNWNSGLKLTHFWDCNGFGCDATTLQPWDLDKYVASPGYVPQDPNDFGGAKYGEKLWLTGAASDTFANLLGPSDACCGSDTDSIGCGKCALIRVPGAKYSEWTALVMKKNRCPPSSNGCEAGNVHFDVAVPGYDNLAFSTANVCGERENTGLSKTESSALGDWYNTYSNTAEAASRCSQLPAEFQKSCEIFSEWGWNSGDPTAEYQVVDCPEAFKEYISSQFDSDGPVSATPAPTGSQPATSIPTVSQPATSIPTTAGDGACYISQCGCPNNFKESWCSETSHRYVDNHCSKKENCLSCSGAWCPFAAPPTTAITPSPSITQSPTSVGNDYIHLDFSSKIPTFPDFIFHNSVSLSSNALRFQTTGANFGSGFLKSTFGVPANHWGRLWVKFDPISLTGNLGHWVGVAAGVGENQIRLFDINSNEAGKVVFQLGWQDDAFQKTTSWSNKYPLSSDWACYEWVLSADDQTFDFFANGNQVAWENFGSELPAGRTVPGQLDWIGFGAESFGGAGVPISGLYDDIVIAAARIGCGAPPNGSPTPTTALPTSSSPTTATPATCESLGKWTNAKCEKKCSSEATSCHKNCAKKCSASCHCNAPDTAAPASAPTSSAPSSNSPTSSAPTNLGDENPDPENRCALSACGCNLDGQQWCNDSNGWDQSFWCNEEPGNCQTCGGVWCSTRRLLAWART